MIIGIVGLGLIGGSMCKAIKENTSHTVYGYDLDKSVISTAISEGAVDKSLSDSNIGKCDYILLSVYPQATIDFLKNKSPLINKSAIVIDCCGIKRYICKECFLMAEEYGYTFIGGHPMAGLHHSGFAHAAADMFCGATMILTPPTTFDVDILGKVSAFFKSLRFSCVTITTPDEHDSIIAFTSQLAHVVSNAYVKSPRAKVHKGFSAGSYKDLTRVARLNENMWSELFMENKDNLLFEIDNIISALNAYKDAMTSGDTDTLRTLLKDGSDRKKEIDF